LLDYAVAAAACDEDDEDNGDAEPSLGSIDDREADLASCDAIVDQRRIADGAPDESDGNPDDEPSLGGFGDGDPDFDQRGWADGDRLDRETTSGVDDDTGPSLVMADGHWTTGMTDPETVDFETNDIPLSEAEKEAGSPITFPMRDTETGKG
jgi:hypothetical protein